MLGDFDDREEDIPDREDVADMLDDWNEVIELNRLSVALPPLKILLITLPPPSPPLF